MKNINNRTTEYNIEDIFLKRYSPRAMSGEPISKEELMTLLEAAHWAPSASNNQPWRFLYAVGGTSDFDLFFSFLNEPNQVWCKNGGALIILLSKKTTTEGKPMPTHTFDAGSAWENLALQGAAMDLVIHGMAGYKKDILVKELNIPEDYDVELMIVVGKHGNIEDLPEPLREREAPRQRNNLSEMAFEGKNGAKLL
ncbi:MAG: nitroreductase family protein [Patescibacteria group bacterium]|nr:nitroreductase family protein [Patescibacteria group bacterium]